MSPPGDRLVERLRAAGCVFAEDEAAALGTHVGAGDLEHAVAKRVAGEPLEYVLGWADFAGVRVPVRAPVFVPRPGAAELVPLSVAELRRRAGRGVVVDVGTGSGAIALAVAGRAPYATVLATDAHSDAVACARANGVAVHRGHWLDALPERWRGRVDVAVGHLPYVPTARLHEVARDYRQAEAPSALDGGGDGLDPLRQVLGQLSTWLSHDGVLLTLTADEQVSLVREVLDQAGRAGEPVAAGRGSTFWRIS